MAKARTNLKGFSKAVDRLEKDLKNLRAKPATTARKSEATALHRKLRRVKALLDRCPDTMFRMFAVAGAPTRKKAKSSRKSTRKGTRKAR